MEEEGEKGILVEDVLPDNEVMELGLLDERWLNENHEVASELEHA